MPQNSSNQGLLSSWKEIARYLDCDERTCRRWEVNFGLPIHRMEGTSKSRVYAYKEELDAWRREKLNGVLHANGKELSTPKLHGSRAAKMMPWLLLLVVIIAAAIFLFRASPGQPQPADFKIDGSKLIILDENGKKLWDYDTGLPNLEPEKAYRKRFQLKVWDSISGGPVFPFLVMADLDLNGKVEVLFSTQVKFDYAGEGNLYCLSANGKELWHRKVGQAVSFGGRTYSSDYRIEAIQTIDVDGDGNLEILICAYHNPHSPSLLLILNSGGTVLGDFFNYGQMHDFLFCDLDGDRKKELLVAGQNDEYGKGCLIVFDPSQLKGCSPQFVEYPGPDLGLGSEISYLLFPRTDVDLTLNPLKECMREISFLQNERIQLVTGTSRLYFELAPDLQLQDIKGSDFFRLQHRELKAAGKISSTLDDAYFEELNKGVLYWDGEQWTSTPTMNWKR